MRCPNCRVETAAGDFCAHCGAQLPAVAPQKETPPTIEQLFEQARAKRAADEMATQRPAQERAADPQDPYKPHNNSGTGGPAPQEVLDMGFCWPGFLFSRYWQMAHGILLGWQAFGSLGRQWLLGDKGYELAWQHRHFASLAQFKQTMSAWVTAAKLVPGLILGVLVAQALLRAVGR
jgi:hypothetical protein